MYGITVTRANIRIFHTADCITSQSDDSEFDLLQETAVDPAEPVIILHESTNRAWYFIQMGKYQGWLEYVEPAEFLTVIASKLKVGEADSHVTKGVLPCASHARGSQRLIANAQEWRNLP
ncbi:SH3 domain-containing protein [Sporomusa sp.]|uniref:SH3 domain-containing protein n=1 Tax=Sporomusa sp. TaxID=2078658 RepID=UPI002CB93B8C|nr:SH3 domain-containing protein [Sporomusa sp.]HWR41600.1 SH3 domain-containing protein [Sporomusa sp.]